MYSVDPVTGKKTEIKKETNVNRLRDGAASSSKEVSGNTRIMTSKTTTNLMSQNRQQTSATE